MCSFQQRHHSFRCPLVSTFRRRHSHYIPLCCLLVLPRSVLHFTMRTGRDITRRDAVRRVRWAEKEASLIHLDVHLATTIGATAAPLQPMALPAQLTSPVSACALSFSVFLSLSVHGLAAKIFAKMPYSLLIP